MSVEALASVPIGQRVTLRRRLEDGRPTDTIGVLTSRDGESVTLETRQGPVRVLLSTIQVFRVVPPTPWRIANFLARGEIAVLGLGALVGQEAATKETADLVEQLLSADTPVFLLADDVDEAGAELEAAGLGHLTSLLLCPDADQPGSDVLALAHARLQDQLGEVVAANGVHFVTTDPRAVDDARELGWQARIFTPPS